MQTKLFVSVLVAVLAVAALCALPAMASPVFWTDASKTTPLRDRETSPKDHPDTLEFANQGPVTFSAVFPAGTVSVSCSEVELGTTVVINDGVEETTLSVPFGLFQGNQCVGSDGFPVPTRVQALPPGQGTGVVGTAPDTALITVAGSAPPFIATLHHMVIWQDFGGKFCAWNLDLVGGLLDNATAEFVEEAPANLSMRFSEVEVPITHPRGTAGCPTTGTFSAEFLLETMSTDTDTAFIG
jgi:hypothetical protein